MRVVPARPGSPPYVETPFRILPVGRDREIRVTLATSDAAKSVMVRQHRWDENTGTMVTASPPMFVFAANLPGLVDALIEARDAICPMATP